VDLFLDSSGWSLVLVVAGWWVVAGWFSGASGWLVQWAVEAWNGLPPGANVGLVGRV
jgi:hypothetical protein